MLTSKSGEAPQELVWSSSFMFSGLISSSFLSLGGQRLDQVLGQPARGVAWPPRSIQKDHCDISQVVTINVISPYAEFLYMDSSWK